MAESVKMTNRELQRNYNSVTVLANRRMANVGADMKVGRLQQALQPHAEILEKARRRIAMDILSGSSLDEMPDLRKQLVSLQIEQAESDLLDQETEVMLPMAYALKEADLPKEQTGSDGWKNGGGLGILTANLGRLFVWDEEK